jgi:ligand-binding SRPBCC domain-containing protein
MSLHILNTSQRLPISITDAWDFLSSPGNLKKITPEGMGFQITTGFDGSAPDNAIFSKMYPGMIIAYIVKPILNLPIKWVTEITHVQEPYYFVDEQRFGPYKFWHHKHFLREVSGGVEMFDTVHYKLPLGPFGDLLNTLFIKKKLAHIFEYRYNKLEKLFGKI